MATPGICAKRAAVSSKFTSLTEDETRRLRIVLKIFGALESLGLIFNGAKQISVWGAILASAYLVLRGKMSFADLAGLLK